MHGTRAIGGDVGCSSHAKTMMGCRYLSNSSLTPSFHHASEFVVHIWRHAQRSSLCCVQASL